MAATTYASPQWVPIQLKTQHKQVVSMTTVRAPEQVPGPLFSAGQIGNCLQQSFHNAVSFFCGGV